MRIFAAVLQHVLNESLGGCKDLPLQLSWPEHVICNLGVVGSNPTRGSRNRKASDESVEKGGYQSGQMGQTVNLLAFAFGGSNPSPPTSLAEIAQLIRALAFQAGGRGFESRFPLKCCNSSVVEHFLGKEEVLSSTLSYSSLLVLLTTYGSFLQKT